jgi:hypothetical protein
MTEQPPYSLLVRGIDADVLPVAEQFGMGVLPWLLAHRSRSRLGDFMEIETIHRTYGIHCRTAPLRLHGPGERRHMTNRLVCLGAPSGQSPRASVVVADRVARVGAWSAPSRTSSVVGVGASIELVEVTQKRLAVSMHSDLAGGEVCVHLTLMPPPGPRTVADPPAHGTSRHDNPTNDRAHRRELATSPLACFPGLLSPFPGPDIPRERVGGIADLGLRGTNRAPCFVT